MNSGQKLWKRAKRVIPGGNMLLSKNPDQFLPNQWPTYFSKAKGCRVWDIEGNCYNDMSVMSVGTNILGYGQTEVDDAVIRAVKFGNMSTLNCPEEVHLAEKLVEMHPWSDMVRLSRSGGEANTIAIRIARAASNKEKVAVCGYHGWHDWYLAVNLFDQQGLNKHLLPGLEPNGVPCGLKGTVFPFNYNHFEELEALVEEHDVGVINMEVSRNIEPAVDFLRKVRDLAHDRGIVLIFDECTSGFRENFGGLHKLLGIDPDIAIFGKALGNGYAISAVIGRKEVMEAAQDSFISSTFWTERIGSVAALKTLEVMDRIKSWEIIKRQGLEVRSRWKGLADQYGLPIEINGLPALSSFTIPSVNWPKYKTLICQEMLKHRFLASNMVYVCTEHRKDVVDAYFDKLSQVFSLIEECESGREIDDLLVGPVCQTGFRRLN